MASIYAYTARDGEGGFVAGSLQADNREQALAHLRTRPPIRNVDRPARIQRTG